MSSPPGPQSILDAHGYGRSLRDKLPVDAGGGPLPMYTYPAIEYLAQLDFAEAAVLEFGSGQSSLWWAARAARVDAVEHDDRWVRRLEERALPNVTCLFAKRPDIVTAEKYLAMVPEGRRYDVLALDGLHYYEVAAAARRLLSPGGLVILDNADFYPATCSLLREQDLLEVDFAGFKPCHLDTQVTSLFFDRAFARRATSTRQPAWPVGGERRTSVFDQPRRIEFDPADPGRGARIV